MKQKSNGDFGKMDMQEHEYLIYFDEENVSVEVYSTVGYEGR